MTIFTQAPYGWTIDYLVDHVKNGPYAQMPDGRFVPARGYGFYGLKSRLRLALAVFRGEADALFWPGQRTDAH